MWVYEWKVYYSKKRRKKRTAKENVTELLDKTQCVLDLGPKVAQSTTIISEAQQLTQVILVVTYNTLHFS